MFLLCRSVRSRPVTCSGRWSDPPSSFILGRPAPQRQEWGHAEPDQWKAVPVQALIIILALVAFAVLIMTINRAAANRFGARWQLAADILDLELEPVGRELFRIHGNLGGFAVEVDVYFASTSRGQDRYTRYRVFYDDLGLGLRLRRQRAWTKAAASLIGGDTEVDDTEFDKAFLVAADDDEAVRAFLTQNRKSSLLFLVQDYPDFVATDDTLSWRRKGVDEGGEIVAGHLQRLVEGARQLVR